MLSDEERKAMKYFYNLRATIDESNMLFDEDIDVKCGKETIKQITIVLNLIEKHQKEIEHQKEKRENQKKELAILNAKQVEFNKLVNTVNLYKGQFKRQQKEIEELKEIYQTGYVNGCVSKVYEINKKWKDKIKAKIEELKDGTFDAKIVLQSLLEKE